MTDLLLLKPVTEEAERSPEMRYLASCVLAAARRSFGAVEVVACRPGSGGQAASLPEGVPVLVFGQENLHLGAESFASMRRALAAGANLVVPERLASFDLAGEAPSYTLQGFERLERRLLEEQSGLAARPRSHLPVALFSPAFFAAHLRPMPLARLLAEEGLLEKLDPAAAAPVAAGIFHDYIDYYGEVRDDILPFVPEGVRDVLEVGCGRGVTGELLQQRLGCRVTGVEMNPEVAKQAARHLDRVIVGDVEALEIEGRFDAVVATELFEHLCYPEAFLEKMRRLLRPGGRIVLSVPNVGHYSVVEDLLAGRWDYLPIGLLCYTHFRFFTRATLVSWLERLGFSQYEIVAQTTELPERFAGPSGLSGLSDHFEIDRESLRTKGFYVVVRVDSASPGNRS